jgi:signal transduction histidine kinase
MGNSKSGIDYYTKALNLSKQIQDNAAISFLYNNLGNCYLDLKNLNTAKNYIDSGFVIAKQNQSLSLLRNTYRALSKFETLNGDFLKADEYYDKYESYRDSVLNVEKIKAVSEIQTKYDVQAKEKEILTQRTKSAELEKKLYASFGIVASLVLTLLLFWQYSQNKLKKRELINLSKLNNERNRIARDLHDNLGAELTVVASKLDTKIFKTENGSDKNDLIQLADLTRNAGVVLRETVWSIKSEKLTVFSLKDKIEEHIQRIESNENLVFDVQSQDIEAELSPTVALNFFRITQEAISNILKYSNAKKANIKLDSKSLEIMDNGIGFEVNSIKKGYGLNNMETRTKEINAQFSIRSDQNGTTILVSLR